MRRTLVAVGLLFAAVACAAPPPAVELASRRVMATPKPVAKPSPTPVPTPARAARPAPAPRPDAGSSLLAAPAAPLAAFHGLGSWIDVYDHNDDPASVVPLVHAMADRGVQTLYIESSRYAAPADIQFPNALGAALDAAKDRGLRVVAWYPPAFGDVELDLRRSIAAVRFRSPRGRSFDAFGADIEYPNAVPDHAERSRRAIDYSRRLRAAVGPAYPMAAIVIAPTALERNPGRWPGFPWVELRGLYEIFMPMNYWTGLGKDAGTAASLTARNAVETKRLTGRPVHVIGGLGDSVDEAQAAAYVTAAREGGSIGGGLYDFTTTRAEVWDELHGLR